MRQVTEFGSKVVTATENRKATSILKSPPSQEVEKLESRVAYKLKKKMNNYMNDDLRY